MKRKKVTPRAEALSRAAGRALQKAAKRARTVARAYGTPVYVWKNGKVVAEKP